MTIAVVFDLVTRSYARASGDCEIIIVDTRRYQSSILLTRIFGVEHGVLLFLATQRH